MAERNGMYSGVSEVGVKIHLIDDDLSLHSLLAAYFEPTPFTLSASGTPSEGLDSLEQSLPDLVIIDVMMPEMDGFELCQEIRKRHPFLPIIMLTARGDDLSKIMGLEVGADDYLSKPFNPRELEARMHSILRRLEQFRKREAIEENILKVFDGRLLLNIDSREVSFDGGRLDLTATEFDLLRILIENKGIVQRREALMQKMRGYDWDSFDRSIDMHISKLRQKLGDNSKKPQLIKTVWGIGYILP